MNKENNERIEKIKDFIRDKGVYLVLMLCMAVIGIAAAAAYLPPKGELQPSPLPEQAQLAEQVSYSEDESLSALLSPSPTPEATPAPVPDARGISSPWSSRFVMQSIYGNCFFSIP